VFETIERVAKLIQNAVIILGIFGGVFSLLHAQYDKRVDRTLAFTKDYTSGVRKSYLSLVAAWNNYAEKQNFFQKDEGGQKQLIANFFGEDPGREQSFEDVADFYDTLYVCVDRRSCDRNSALDFFGSNASTFFESFAFHIFALREAHRDNTIGKGVEQMYRMTPESWWSTYV
jgi:hypothetical protein